MRRVATCLIAAQVFAVSVFAIEAGNGPSGSLLGSRQIQLPLYFIENQGQTAGPVRYYVHGRETAAFFTDEGMSLLLAEPRRPGEQTVDRRWGLRLELVGARSDLEAEGLHRTDAVVSYFKGSQEDWKTSVATFDGVRYRDVWPGIDVVWEGGDGRLKSSFVVKPGGDPARIRLRWAGAETIGVSPAGELEVTTGIGRLTETRPYAYQEVNGRRQEIPARYSIVEGHHGFQVEDFDPSRELVIDPVALWYSGYVGGNGQDFALGGDVDGAGNLYLAGYTWSPQNSFPVKVGPDLTYAGGNELTGGTDAYVAKVDPTGAALVYAGYIGGSLVDFGTSVAVDASGNAYVLGYTQSGEDSFPVLTGPKLTHDSPYTRMAFVTKVNAAGNGLVYSGYIDGSLGSRTQGIALDPSDNAYAIGDAFVAKVQASGAALDYNFPLAGPGGGVAVDAAGHAYVSQGSEVWKINPTGTGTIFTFSLKSDPTPSAPGPNCGGLAVDSAGNVYVAGTAADGVLPVVGGPDLTYNGGASDAFLAKLNPSGTGLVYAGYVGGSGDDGASVVAVDAAGNAYLAGWTNSTEATFPVLQGPDLTYNGGGDVFVAKVSAGGGGLSYAGYFGGSASEGAASIAIDASGNVYLVGTTYSTEVAFPVLIGPDLTSNQVGPMSPDAFVAKMGMPPAAQPTSLTLHVSPSPSLFGQRVNLKAQIQPAGAYGVVAFLNGPQLIGNAQLDPSGAAEIDVLDLPAGAHSLKAAYLGATHAWLPSQSNVTNHVVNPVPSGSLSGPFNYPVGTSPQTIATGDFNNDGLSDLVVGNRGSGSPPASTLSFLIGNGDGTFHPATSQSVCAIPVSIVVQDLNADGNSDLAVACGIVDILAGDGMGNFSLSSTLQLKGVPPPQGNNYPPSKDMLAGDFDGDLLFDLASANSWGASIASLIPGDGDGTFRVEDYRIYAGPPYGGWIEQANLNGDANEDLIVTSDPGGGQPGFLNVFLGNGNGAFQGPAQLSADPVGYSIDSGDLNGDQKTDVVTVHGYPNNRMALRLGMGDGTFQPPSFVTIPGGVPLGVQVADINGDGPPDLAVGVNWGNSVGGVSILAGNGDGTFQPSVDYGAGNSPRNLLIADFNQDGRADVAATNLDDVSVLLSGDCTYSLSDTSEEFAKSGLGDLPIGFRYSFDVNAPTGCAWSAIESESWMYLDPGGSGVGSGTITYNVLNNLNGSPRQGTIRVNGAVHTVSQSTVTCSYAFQPPESNLPAAGGGGSVDVVAPYGCHWTAFENLDWLSITSGGAGNGNGTIYFNVDPAGIGGSRQGTIAVTGAQHTVKQVGAACTYDIQPTSNTFPASGGAGSINVTAPGGCAWTASESLSWVTITSGASGSGNGSVGYTVNAKTTQGGRNGAISVAGLTHTVSQSGVNPTPSGPLSSVGVVSDGRWLLDLNANDVFDPGVDRDWIFGGFGASQQVVGDWDGDGDLDAGVYNLGYWFLDANGDGAFDGGTNDKLFAFGFAGATPVVGDWNGDGRDEVGVYANGFWFLDYDGDAAWDGGIADKLFGFGWPGAELVIGDWNGDGRDKIGVFSAGFFFLDVDGSYSWDGGIVDKAFPFGWAGVTPLTGDWNGDGKDEAAFYINGAWFFDYDGDMAWNPAAGDRLFLLGWAGAVPVVGDWNGDGRDKAGLFSSGTFYLEHNGDAVWNTSQGDRIVPWGDPAAIPVPGPW